MAKPAESGPRSHKVPSMPATSMPSSGSKWGSLRKRPTIPHMRLTSVSVAFFQSPLTSHSLTHLSIQRHISFLRGNYGGRRHLDFKGVPAIGPKPSATPTTGALMRRPSTIKFRTVGSRDAIPDVDSELRTGSLAPSELPP